MSYRDEFDVYFERQCLSEMVDRDVAREIWEDARKSPASGKPVAWECSGEPGTKIDVVTSMAAADHYQHIGRTVRPLVYADTHPPSKVPEGQVMVPRELLTEYYDLVADSDFTALHKLIRKDAISALLTTPTPATTPETEWVKCADQMPPDRKAVIVWCYASGCCGYAHYSYEKGEWLMPEPQPAGYNRISHWMHFPTPPQEQ